MKNIVIFQNWWRNNQKDMPVLRKCESPFEIAKTDVFKNTLLKTAHESNDIHKNVMSYAFCAGILSYYNQFPTERHFITREISMQRTSKTASNKLFLGILSVENCSSLFSNSQEYVKLYTNLVQFIKYHDGRGFGLAGLFQAANYWDDTSRIVFAKDFY